MHLTSSKRHLNGAGDVTSVLPTKDIQQFDSEEIAKVWSTYELLRANPNTNKAGKGYLTLRNYLFSQYYTFTIRECRAFYNRYMPDNPSISLGDAENEACIALLQCLERYDSNRGVRFEIFLRDRLQGQIIDCLRSLQPFPRDVANKKRRVNHHIETLQHKLNKLHPTYEDYTAEFGEVVAKDLLDDLIYSSVFNQPVDAIRKQEVYTTPTRKFRQKEQSIKGIELTVILIEIINTHIKDEIERDSLVFYFLMGYNYKDISISLEVSISTISNKINSGRDKLRVLLRKSRELKEHLGFV